MSDLVWINGEVQNLSDARIGVEDRGFQFADGVYEVIRLYGQKPFALDRHLKRLRDSAAAIQLSLPLDPPALGAEIVRFLPRAAVADGMIYLQLTRGVAPRNHAFSRIQPTLLFYARQLPPAGESVKLITVPDERWKRCWIKSIALLPNVLAKNQALAAGADEAVFLDDHLVTECSSSNIFAVIGDRLITPSVGPKVLPGITRAILLELAHELAIPAEERFFTEDDVQKSDELFITSTTREISWVSHWNGRRVGQAACGPVTRKMHAALRELIRRQIA